LPRVGELELVSGVRALMPCWRAVDIEDRPCTVLNADDAMLETSSDSVSSNGVVPEKSPVPKNLFWR
jgi:hypothetical protein